MGRPAELCSRSRRPLHRCRPRAADSHRRLPPTQPARPSPPPCRPPIKSALVRVYRRSERSPGFVFVASTRRGRARWIPGQTEEAVWCRTKTATRNGETAHVAYRIVDWVKATCAEKEKTNQSRLNKDPIRQALRAQIASGR